MDTFNFLDYDCIGFDLDNTISEYNEQELAQLIYVILATYMVNQKNYDPELLKSILPNIDFLRKGLTLDLVKGNIIDIAYDSTILKASHGTKLLTNAEIASIYGENRKWELAKHHCADLLSTWNGELSTKIRSCSDYFDLIVPLLFGRAVDSIDERAGGVQETYNVWPDILDALIYMFQKEKFQTDEGEYYPALKEEPQKYIRRCSPALKKWLKEVKNSTKLTFLVTGSNTDYASFIAENSLGEDWKKYFDVIIFFARKPGFFVQDRPFYTALEDSSKDTLVPELKRNSSYTQGNWTELLKFIKKETEKTEPKCLFIGDNLVQDIYAPNMYKCCDTVAIVKELYAECECKDSVKNTLLTSQAWGSFFYDKEIRKYTLWGQLIREYSKICVPSLEWFAYKPLNATFPEFKSSELHQREYDISGHQNLFPPCHF